MNSEIAERLGSSVSASTTDAAAPHVAVVGSGPSGCYTAQMLRKRWPHASITVFDRLPVPFGLLRYGVSPDHQGTKAVSRQFARIFRNGAVRFVGNVEVGRDVSIGQLRDAFDVVVLATGLGADCTLPGISGDGVYGAGRIMRWFNAHPDELLFEPRFGSSTAIVGSGNVAVDVLRLLSKHRNGFSGSDLDHSRLDRRPSVIHLVGRSTPSSAKFDVAMIRELSTLDDVAFDVTVPKHIVGEDSAESAKFEALRQLVERPLVTDPRVRVHFHFGWVPTRLDHGVQGKTLELTDSTSHTETVLLGVDSVITAIGFRAALEHEIDRTQQESDRSDIDAGVLDDGLYCVGWFRRGPTGGIPENRSDAKLVTERIVRDVERCQADSLRPGVVGLTGLLSDTVDFEGWLRIDQFESNSDALDRCRTKVPDIATMLEIARRI